MHFTVLSLFKLFACSKSFNVLLLTNMEKKSSESPDHDLHLCSRFCPLSRCWKEVFATLHNGAELYVRQHHHGPARLFLFKNTLACPEKDILCCFWTVYIIRCQIYNCNYWLHTIWFLEKKIASIKNCVFRTNAIKEFGWGKSFWTKFAVVALCREGRFQPVCAAVTNLCAINL